MLVINSFIESISDLVATGYFLSKVQIESALQLNRESTFLWAL